MKFLFVWALCLLTFASSAQNLLGISTSPYGGTNRIYLNPALAADSPHIYYLNVFSGGAHLNNDFVRYQAPYSLLRLLSGTVPSDYKRPNGTLRFAVEYTEETLNGKPKDGTVWGEVRGPSLLLKVGSRGGLAITTRLRAAAQVKRASEPLLSAVRAGLNDGTLYSIPSNDNQFSANTNTYSELGATYAGTVWEGDGEKLLLGVTAKLLIGYNAQSFVNRGLNYQLIADPTVPDGVALEVQRLDATLAYTTFLQNRSLTPSRLLSPSSPGRGFGFDLGLTYIAQYDEDSPAMRLGFAISDIGGIRYKGQSYEYGAAESTVEGVRFTSSDFNNVGSGRQIIRIIQQRLDTGGNPNQGNFRTGLPTSLNLTADFQSPKGLGIGFTYLQDLRSAQAMAVHQPTLLAVTPRFDSQRVGLTLPISYLNNGLTAGLSLRLGPGFLGTDNLLGLIGSSRNGIRPRGLDIYGGLAFGVGRED